MAAWVPCEDCGEVMVRVPDGTFPSVVRCDDCLVLCPPSRQVYDLQDDLEDEEPADAWEER